MVDEDFKNILVGFNIEGFLIIRVNLVLCVGDSWWIFNQCIGGVVPCVPWSVIGKLHN